MVSLPACSASLGRLGVLSIVLPLFLVLGLLVTACDGGGSEPPPPPSTPQGLTAVSTGSGIALSWNAGAVSDDTGFNVYRVEGTEASADGSPVNGSTPISEPAFEDTGVSEGVVYSYAVTAVNAGGESSASSGVTIRFFPDPPGRPSE